MFIKVFDKTGKLISSDHFQGSLSEFLKKEAGENYSEDVKPYSALLNGAYYSHERHSETLNDDDVIDLTLEPRGTVANIIIALLSAAYSYYVTSNINNDYSDPETGDSIYSSNARANQVRPNQTIREVSGTVPIYPDYINPVRRRYESGQEYIYLMLSIGVGYFDIGSENFYISDTPIDYYASDISLSIFEPNDDVTGDISHENWYTSPNVSNLDLKTAIDDPVAEWGAVFDSSGTIQSYDDGVAVPFPFNVGSIIYVSSASSSNNVQLYRVDSLSTTTATDDTATVTVMTEVSPSVYEEDSSGSITTTPLADVSWNAVSGGLNWEGPFVLCPEGETATHFEFDVRFPAGLNRITGGGSQVSFTVAIEVQYRDSATGGDWATVPSTSWTANTRDELGYTIVQALGASYNPEVRIRRVTGDSGSSQVTERLEIVRIKANLESQSSYSKVTTAALRIRSTRALSRTSENRISVRGAQRKLPTLAEIQDFVDNGNEWDISSSSTVTEDYYNVERISGRVDYFSDDVLPIAASQSVPRYSILSDNGEYLYVFYNTLGAIDSYRFSLATAYSPSREDFSSYDASPQFVIGSFPNGQEIIQMLNGGLKILTKDSSSCYVYLLSTARDFDTINTTPSETFSFSGSDAIETIHIRNGKMYATRTGAGVAYIEQYTLGASDNISLAVNDNVDYDLVANGAQGGEFLYVRDEFVLAGGETIYKFVTTSGLLENISAADGSYFFGAEYINLFFNNDGSSLFRVGAILTSGLDTSGTTGILTELEIYEYNSLAIFDTRATSSAPRFLAYALADRIGRDLSGYLDWTALSALDALLDSRGDQLNGEFSNETTLWEAAKLMLAVGYSEPTVKNGELTAVRAAAGTGYTQLYTPDIMIGGVTTKSSHDDSDEPDGIIVEYLNADTGINETVNAYLSGDQGIKPKKINAFGITNRIQAWRYGMRERERFRLKPREYSFSTEMDALNSFYGDAIGIVDELDLAQFGKVTDASGSVITTDQTLNFQGSDLAFFRDDSGLSHGPFQVSPGVESNQINLDSPSTLGFALGDADVLFSMGTAEEVVKRAIVRSIQVSNDKTCEIICEEYLNEIYQHDESEP